MSARQVGEAMARKVFRLRGGKSEAHMGEVELAALLTTAIELGMEAGADKNAALESLFATASIALGQMDDGDLGVEALATSLRTARRALGRGEG